MSPITSHASLAAPIIAPIAGSQVLTDMTPRVQSRRANWLDFFTEAERRAIRHVGLRVRAARLSRRSSRAELAVAAGLNAAHVGTIERGENNTTLLSLVRLGSALGMQVGQLLAVIR